LAPPGACAGQCGGLEGEEGPAAGLDAICSVVRLCRHYANLVPGTIVACRIAASRISPGGGPFPSATLMDSKFIGINAFPVLNYAHGG
jgi:hypothetical protein